MTKTKDEEMKQFVKKVYTLNDKAKSNKSPYLCISVYHPQLTTKKEFTKSIKSQLLSCLRNTSELKNSPQAPQKITDELLRRFLAERSKKHSHGIALFAVCHYQEIDRASSDEVASFIDSEAKEVAGLTESEFFVNSVFDTTRLFLADRRQIESLIIGVREKQITVDTLFDDHLKRLDSFDNYFTTTQENRYITKMSVTRNTAIRHGTGSDKIVRQQESGNEYFLKEIIDSLIENKKLIDSVKQIVIFYSNKFEEAVQESVIPELEENFHNKLLVVIPELPVTKEELIEVAQERIYQAITNKAYDIAQEAKEDYHRLVIGWDEVKQAATNHKIQRIFLSPIQTANEREKIEAAELAKVVFENSGSVVVSQQFKELFNKPVAAQLFYPKKKNQSMTS